MQMRNRSKPFSARRISHLIGGSAPVSFSAQVVQRALFSLTCSRFRTRNRRVLRAGGQSDCIELMLTTPIRKPATHDEREMVKTRVKLTHLDIDALITL
jgi:hypothetical protein